jgi:uncharacterized protein YecT (DUF1311 family)
MIIHCASAAEEGCKDPTTTAAMRACENNRYAKAKHELEVVVERLMKELDQGQRVKLQRTQRAWTVFRDANADFLSSAVQGGTLAPLIKVTTLADMTEARTRELQKLEIK